MPVIPDIPCEMTVKTILVSKLDMAYIPPVLAMKSLAAFSAYEMIEQFEVTCVLHTNWYSPQQQLSMVVQKKILHLFVNGEIMISICSWLHTLEEKKKESFGSQKLKSEEKVEKLGLKIL